ncbi:MAG TPA: hypothetical protein VIV66_09480 [Pyrinomonadaceae bacterium]
MSALVAACNLVGTTRLGKDADVHMLHVGACHGKGNEILRLARRRTCMTADAASIVYNLGPFYGLGLWLIEHPGFSLDRMAAI